MKKFRTSFSGYNKEDVNAFVGDEKQFDDLTMMCIRIN